MNYEVAVASRLTRVFALNYFRRDYKTAVAFMDKLWMDLDREGFEIRFDLIWFLVDFFTKICIIQI